MRPEIRYRKGHCDVHPDGYEELFGVELTFCPKPETQTFICECCLRTMLANIEKKSYMEEDEGEGQSHT